MMSKKLAPTFGLLLATLAWGLSFFLIKVGINQLGVWPMLFARYNLAFVAIFVLFPKKILRPTFPQIKYGFFLGVLLFASNWTQTQGLAYTSISHSGFITSLYVPFTPFFGWLFFRRKVSQRDMFVVLVATVGLYILTYSNGGGSSLRGDIWTLFTAILYAIQIVATERITRKEVDSIALGVWQFFWCAVCVDLTYTALRLSGQVTPTAHVFNFWAWPSIVLVAIIFNALVATDFAFTMQIICQKYVSSLRAALIFALEAPLATLFAFFLKGDSLSRYELIGAALVFLASLWPDRWLKQKRDTNHGSL
jgi:drug/metabolite transporter (DMT)-like permease